MTGTLRLAIHDTATQEVYPYTFAVKSASEANLIKDDILKAMDYALANNMTVFVVQRYNAEDIELQVPAQCKVAWEYTPS